MREALVKWSFDMPPGIHRALFTDEHPSVRAAAVSHYHPPPPPDLHEAVLADPATGYHVIEFVDLTEEPAERLCRDPHETVRSHLARHPRLPESLRYRLADGPARARIVLSRLTALVLPAGAGDSR